MHKYIKPISRDLGDSLPDVNGVCKSGQIAYPDAAQNVNCVAGGIAHSAGACNAGGIASGDCGTGSVPLFGGGCGGGQSPISSCIPGGTATQGGCTTGGTPYQ